MANDCFVVMAISDQKIGDHHISSENLKSKYENLIKKAVLEARPNIEIIRSDEVNDQGTITTDILTRLLFSDFVIVDITYPNPNVYYELGIRHCCNLGTILIKDKDVDSHAPFDVSHERYIEYSNTTEGLSNLVAGLKEKFAWYDANPAKPDNHVLIHAKTSKFSFPQYGQENEVMKKQEEGMNEIIHAIIDSEPMFNALMNMLALHLGEQNSMVIGILDAAQEDKEMVFKLISGFMKLGILSPQKLIESLTKS